MLVCTIPLAPFLTGRGNNKKRRKLWRDTSSIPPAKGAAPLWTPPGTPTTVGVPLVGTPRPSGRTIPLAPFLGRGNNKKRRKWHILHSSCQWGCTPLDSPFGAWHILHSSCQWGCTPLDSPFGAWHILHSSCQWGCAPLDSPFGARHILHSSCQWGCTPLHSRLIRAGGHPKAPAKGLRLAGGRPPYVRAQLMIAAWHGGVGNGSSIASPPAEG